MRQPQAASSRPILRVNLSLRNTGCAALITAFYWWMLFPVLISAYRAAFGIAHLPRPLALIVTKLPTAFPVHMVASAAALALVPITVAAAYRRPTLHRSLGKAAVGCIAVGGLTSLAVSAHSVASAATRYAFTAQGLVWLALTAYGIEAVRRRQIALHRRLMIAVAIVTVSPVALRILMHVAVANRLPFQRTYAVVAWAVWLVPLLAYGTACLLGQLVAAQAEGPTKLNLN